MNQKKINRILIIVLIALVGFIAYSRITEQKRVEYYICYNTLVDSYPDQARDMCKERND
jgi:hypothetical protein